MKNLRIFSSMTEFYVNKPILDKPSVVLEKQTSKVLYNKDDDSDSDSDSYSYSDSDSDSYSDNVDDSIFIIYDEDITPGDYIDLGLPSGTRWASCNLGASVPEGYGDFYAWGETTPKEVYNWSTYKYGSEWNDLTKYNTQSFRVPVDNKTVLESEDDAVYAATNGAAHMPTKEQIDELINNTLNYWGKLNDVFGRLFIGSNGNSIFIPAAGNQSADYLYSRYYYFYVWSASLNEGSASNAWSLYSGSVSAGSSNYGRYLGFSVRGCKDSNSDSDSESYSDSDSDSDYTFIIYNEDITPGDYIDLGLPSGTKWASCNLGATTPEGYGDFYAWGETTPNKEVYDWSTYKYGSNRNALTKYNKKDGKTELEHEDDVVYVTTNGAAHIPTKEQFTELIDNTISYWGKLNDVFGRIFISKTNGNAIFIPAAGNLDGSILFNRGDNVSVWSASLDERYDDYALLLSSYSYYDDFGIPNSIRCHGFSVRGCQD